MIEKRWNDKPIFKMITVTILILSVAVNVIGASFVIFNHIKNESIHFSSGKQKRKVIAFVDEGHCLTREQTGKVLSHIKDETIHMPLEKKIEMFLTRHEADQINESIKRLDKSIRSLEQSIRNFKK